MPRIIRDFVCECGESYERYVEVNCREIQCKCGKKAQRIIGMPTVSLEGISGDFPGAASKWATIREKRHQQNAKKR